MTDGNLELVALTPGDMAPTQALLSSWCDRKRTEVTGELTELRDHLLIAKSNGWKLAGLENSIRRAERRVLYYGRMKDAIDAGYVIVPNFPAEVLAVRVSEYRDRPHRGQETDYRHTQMRASPDASLESGEGRYVDEELLRSSTTEVKNAGTPQEKTVTHYQSEGYDEAIDMPWKGVKPQVLDAVGKAMALKVFDRISLVRNQGTDPIFIGEMLDPRGNDRRVTFFIAWWLNTRDL